MAAKIIRSDFLAEVDSWEIAPRFADLLANTGVQFFKDRVKLLCPSDHLGVNGPMTCTHGGTVLLESGLIVEYDWYSLKFTRPLSVVTYIAFSCFLLNNNNISQKFLIRPWLMSVIILFIFFS